MPGADPNGWFITPDGRIEVGQVAQLGPDGLWWLARARSADGRYVLLTTVEEQGEDCSDCAQFYEGRIEVAYTLIDYEERIRGAINVIGHGCGIKTVCGPDPAVASAMRLVTEDGFEVSHRNQVRLEILDVRTAC